MGYAVMISNVFITSKRGVSWTKTHAPCHHGPKREEYADFAHPVSEIFHMMSLDVKSNQYLKYLESAIVLSSSKKAY